MPDKPDINPAIGALLSSARDFLAHEHSLFNSLGLTPLLIGRGKASFSLDHPHEFADCNGDIHGGFCTIVLDSIFGISVFTALDELKPVATINLRTDMVGTAKAGGRAVCAVVCEGQAGDVSYVTGRLTREEDGGLIALGAGAFIVGARGPVAPGSTSGSRL
jgi:acyl-coenzyme A thioesterase PaaI-like protein